MGKEKFYHIYYKNRLLFKSINEEQFNLIWELLNTDYNSELNYSEIIETPSEQLCEHSY